MPVFTMINGTLLNMATVLVGGIIGTLIGNRLSERFTTILFIALGLFTTVTGLQDALYLFSTTSNQTAFIDTHNGLVVLGGLLIGGVIGEMLRIEFQLERLGSWAQSRLSNGKKEESSRIGQGFVTASLLFCIGPLTILGSLANGLTGDIRDLTIKSFLDGFAALALAATLGWGVLLSLFVILIVQGGLSLCAGAITPIMMSNPVIITELTATGGFLLIGIGLRLLKLADLRPGNFLPALIVTPLLVVLISNVVPAISP
jgi:uncharacterized membrane protein YqgA involved in biofilm formation